MHNSKRDLDTTYYDPLKTQFPVIDRYHARLIPKTRIEFILNHLLYCGLDNIQSATPLHSFDKCWELYDKYGARRVRLLYGHASDRRLISIQARGPKTKDIAKSVPHLGWHHRTTRTDLCIDFHNSPPVDRLKDLVFDIMVRHRLTGDMGHDYNGAYLPFKLIAGSAASFCRLLFYSIGLQDRFLHINRPDWVRMELQLRPRLKHELAKVKFLPPPALWASAASWTGDLWTSLASDTGLFPDARSLAQETIYEQSLRIGLSQYYRLFALLAQEARGVTGGPIAPLQKGSGSLAGSAPPPFTSLEEAALHRDVISRKSPS